MKLLGPSLKKQTRIQSILMEALLSEAWIHILPFLFQWFDCCDVITNCLQNNHSQLLVRYNLFQDFLLIYHLSHDRKISEQITHLLSSTSVRF